jgi:4-carboxymuconolactone decarboxylase
MTDERQAFIDDMVKRRGYVLDYHKVMVEHDLEFMKVVDDVIHAAYLEERLLDRRTKELIFIVSLTVMGSAKEHIQSHIRAALAEGVSSQEILEALEIAVPEAGVVAFQRGVEAWREVVGASGIEPSSPTGD